MQSKPLNLNFEERGVWNEMKRELKSHNNYRVRKQFYPHNMEAWEKEHKEIEHKYREHIDKMISVRIIQEKEKAQMIEEEERVEMLVVEEKKLLAKMQRAEKAKKRKAEAENVTPTRRSSRWTAGIRAPVSGAKVDTILPNQNY